MLCLSHDTSIVVATSREELERCNALAFFRNNYFDDLLVLDATGQQFKVVSSSVVAVLLTVVALVAAFVPVRRAVTIDPLVALRAE